MEGFVKFGGQEVFYSFRPMLVEENGLPVQPVPQARRKPVWEVEESGVFLVRAPTR